MERWNRGYITLGRQGKTYFLTKAGDYGVPYDDMLDSDGYKA
jgi:hypothetical protein